jgi:phage portal protein BeeE
MNIFAKAWKAANTPLRMPSLSFPFFGSQQAKQTPLPPTQGRPALVNGSKNQYDDPTTTWDVQGGLKNGMTWSTTAGICLRFRAMAMASLEWLVEEWVGPADDDWRVVARHPFRIHLDNPNPSVTRQNLFYTTANHMDLVGLAYWQIAISDVDKKDPILEFWNLNPAWIDIVRDPVDFITGYRYYPGGRRNKPEDSVFYDPKQIVRFCHPHPYDPICGMGLLELGAKAIDLDRIMGSFIWSSMNNRAIKDGILFVKNLLGAERKAEIISDLNSQGGPDNARGLYVVDAEGDFKSLSQTPAELDFRQSSKDAAVKVCSLTGVLPPVIGILDNSGYNNIQLSQTMTWVNTLVPLADQIASALTLQALQPWYGDKKTKPYRVVPDLSKVPALQELANLKSDTARKYWSMGLPFQDINKRFTLGFRGDIPGTDRGFIPVNTIPSEFANDMIPGAQDPDGPGGNVFDPQTQKPPADTSKEPLGDKPASTSNGKANGVAAGYY